MQQPQTNTAIHFLMELGRNPALLSSFNNNKEELMDDNNLDDALKKLLLSDNKTALKSHFSNESYMTHTDMQIAFYE